MGQAQAAPGMQAPGPSSSANVAQTQPPAQPLAGPSDQSGTAPKTMARMRHTGPKQSPRAGFLPDGRELYLRKPHSRRAWEPIKDHTCESCGGMYPRTPFEWEEMSTEPDGRRIMALRKRCRACAFPGLTHKVKVDTLKATERFVRSLHPDFEISPTLLLKDSPEAMREFTGAAATGFSSNVPAAGTSAPKAAAVQKPPPVAAKLNLQPVSSTQPFPKSFANRPASAHHAPPHPVSNPSFASNMGQQQPMPRSTATPHLMMPQTTSSNMATSGPTTALPTVPANRDVRPTTATQPKPPAQQIQQVSSRPSIPGPPSTSRRTADVTAPGSGQRASQVGPIRTKSTDPPAPSPVAASRPGVPGQRTSSQAHEMLDALRRAFHKNPNPSPEMLDMLAATFNIHDERVVPQLFESWRRSGIHLRDSSGGTSTPEGKASKSSRSGRRDFQEGSVELNAQRTPDLTFNPQAEQSIETQEEARNEQIELFDQIVKLAQNGAVEQKNHSGHEEGRSEGVDEAPTAVAVEQGGAAISFAEEQQAVLEPNGLLSDFDSIAAMRVDPVNMQTQTDTHRQPTLHSIEHDVAKHDDTQGRSDVDQPKQMPTGNLQIIIPGMEAEPTDQPQLAPATPPSTVDIVRGETYGATDDVPPSGLAVDAILSAVRPIEAGPDAKPALPSPPITADAVERLVAPLPSRATGPPQNAPRPTAPPVILDIKPHEVKHFSEPMMQQAYEIYTAPEPHRLGNWLRATYKPSTEKYSVLQRDIYTEYKSLFDGSTVGCWSGSQVVKLCREMWPDTALGRRLDNPSEFRIWGIYRVRILPQSPWELLYIGQLKAELFNLVEAKPTEQFKSETLVARMGAPLASMASILSTARLDQTKISTLSAIANKSDLDTFTQKLLRERNTSLWEPMHKFEASLVSHLKFSKIREAPLFEVVPKEKRPKPSVKREIERVQREIDKTRQPAAFVTPNEIGRGDGSQYRPLVLDSQDQTEGNHYPSFPPATSSQFYQPYQAESSRQPAGSNGSYPAATTPAQAVFANQQLSHYGLSPHQQHQQQQQQQQRPQPAPHPQHIQSQWYENTYEPPVNVPNSFLLPKTKRPKYLPPSRPQPPAIQTQAQLTAQHQSYHQARHPQSQPQAQPQRRQIQPRPMPEYDPYDPLNANPPPFPQLRQS